MQVCTANAFSFKLTTEVSGTKTCSVPQINMFQIETFSCICFVLHVVKDVFINIFSMVILNLTPLQADDFLFSNRFWCFALTF